MRSFNLILRLGKVCIWIGWRFRIIIGRKLGIKNRLFNLIRIRNRGFFSLGSIFNARFLIIRFRPKSLLNGWLIGLIVKLMRKLGLNPKIRSLKNRNNPVKTKIKIKNKVNSKMKRTKNQSPIIKETNGKIINEIEIF